MHSHFVPCDFPVEWAWPTTALRPAVAPTTAASRRVMYFACRTGWSPLLIVADFMPDGSADFGEQECGEARWYPHVPSAEERAFAVRLLQAQHDPAGEGKRPLFLETSQPWFVAKD